jgi:hypothetical protein
MNELLSRDTEGPVIVAVFCSVARDAVLAYAEEQRKKIMRAQDWAFRRRAGALVESFVSTVGSDPRETVCSAFVVGAGGVRRHELTADEKEKIRRYGLHHPYWVLDDGEALGSLRDYFLNNRFWVVCVLSKTSTRIRLATATKESTETLPEKEARERLGAIAKEHESPVFWVGKDAPPGTESLAHEPASRREIVALGRRARMMKSHERLKSHLTAIAERPELYVFGLLRGPILEAVESFALRELYIDPKKLERLRGLADASCFNFEIIEIEPLENNDTGDVFFRDYRGMLGVRYYG